MDRPRRPCRARAGGRPRPLPPAAVRWVEDGARAPRRARAGRPRAERALVSARVRAHAGARDPGERRDRRPLPAGLVVRPGTIDDLRATPALVTQIWEHHASAPTFTGLTVPPVEEFLARLGGHPRRSGDRLLRRRDRRADRRAPADGARGAGPRAAARLCLPRRGGHVAGGARQRRRRRADRARAGVVSQAGYPTVHTDWRVANLESSRFWPRRGFRETFYRLARRVNIG